MQDFEKDQAASGVKEKKSLSVDGMTCTNCAQTVNNFLTRKGLENVYVDFTSGKVTYEENKNVPQKEIEKGIRNLGYQVVKDENSGGSYQALKKRFIFSLLLTLPLFLSMFLPFEWLRDPYFQLVLCTPVYVLGAYHFGKSAFSSLRMGVPNMDVLILLGSSAAFFYSLTGTLLVLGESYQFYETAATIITLIMLGNLLEQKSVKQTTTAIDELSRLQVKKARKITGNRNGREEVQEIPVDLLKQDDLLLVNTGDRVPADGEIVWGTGYLDESMITGESIPVHKKTHSKVIGGTILQEGTVKVKVSATGKNTVLSQIIEMVRNAQASKPRIQNLGDKVSAIFVPAVTLITLTTFTISYFLMDISLQSALLRAVAVLVISCPCAMGLATPTAVMVGIGKAAKKGILIKGGKTLEQFARIKQIVFDKTGTLTDGNFKISQLKLYDGHDENEINNVIKKLETHSSHPIARSIVKALDHVTGSPDFKTIQEEKGTGVKAEDHQGNLYKIGSANMLTNGKTYPEHQVYLFKNEALVAGIDLEDQVKEQSGATVEYFNNQKVSTILLSGDKEEKTRILANHLKIREYFAEKSPGEKLSMVQQFSEQKTTAMAGDGINDAPALSRAHVGISLSNATEVAIQSAEVVLLNGKISGLPMAHKISKKTLTTIKQNLFWAFFYNVIAIPVAAAGLLNPMIAALSMAFSDVMVIGNSLRLKIRKFK